MAALIRRHAKASRGKAGECLFNSKREKVMLAGTKKDYRGTGALKA